jgi:hypothetical protein
MEARTVNNLPPAAAHDDAVRCLLGPHAWSSTSLAEANRCYVGCWPVGYETTYPLQGRIVGGKLTKQRCDGSVAAESHRPCKPGEI